MVAHSQTNYILCYYAFYSLNNPFILKTYPISFPYPICYYCPSNFCTILNPRQFYYAYLNCDFDRIYLLVNTYDPHT